MRGFQTAAGIGVGVGVGSNADKLRATGPLPGMVCGPKPGSIPQPKNPGQTCRQTPPVKPSRSKPSRPNPPGHPPPPPQSNLVAVDAADPLVDPPQRGDVDRRGAGAVRHVGEVVGVHDADHVAGWVFGMFVIVKRYMPNSWLGGFVVTSSRVGMSREKGELMPGLVFERMMSAGGI